jgi:hypothetical protein
VVVEGEYLLGDARFTIDAGASRYYQLIYSPLLPKQHHGSIAFIHPKVRAHQLAWCCIHRSCADSTTAPSQS